MSALVSTPVVCVRVANADDLEGILKVVAATHPECQPRPIDQIGHYEQQRAFTMAEFVQPFVAIVDNRVVGCAVVQRQVKPWCAAAAELTWCHTLPGTDHNILHQLEERCREFAKTAWGAVLGTH